MRELTQQEIDNAPAAIEALIVKRNDARASKDWATVDVILDELASMGIVLEDSDSVTSWCRKPITRKTFDIREYEFSDKDIFNHFITKDKSRVNFDFDSELMPSDTIGFNKQDAIALAKHFKLI